MKTCLLFISIIILFSVTQMNGQNQMQLGERKVDYPWVPRVSAYEAYIKYNSGKAIIFHGGGEDFRKRHIMGAYNLDIAGEIRERMLQKFPRKGIELFTYCY